MLYTNEAVADGPSLFDYSKRESRQRKTLNDQSCIINTTLNKSYFEPKRASIRPESCRVNFA